MAACCVGPDQSSLSQVVWLPWASWDNFCLLLLPRPRRSRHLHHRPLGLACSCSTMQLIWASRRYVSTCPPDVKNKDHGPGISGASNSATKKQDSHPGDNGGARTPVNKDSGLPRYLQGSLACVIRPSLAPFLQRNQRKCRGRKGDAKADIIVALDVTQRHTIVCSSDLYSSHVQHVRLRVRDDRYRPEETLRQTARA